MFTTQNFIQMMCNVTYHYVALYANEGRHGEAHEEGVRGVQEGGDGAAREDREDEGGWCGGGQMLFCTPTPALRRFRNVSKFHFSLVSCF